MTSSQTSFKLPTVIGATVQPDPLESLYSPQLNKLSITADRSLGCDSAAVSEFNDIALDDDSFSPVVLSARPVADLSSPSHPQKEEMDTDKEEDVTQNGDIFGETLNTLLPLPQAVPVQYPVVSSLMETAKSHKRTASTITIRSAHSRNNSLRANRVDLQGPNPHRGSVDGHLKLQEEFHRLQEQKEQMTTLESSIDWGVYRTSQYVFVSEYLVYRFLGSRYIWSASSQIIKSSLTNAHM